VNPYPPPSEIDELIDVEEHVVVVVRDYRRGEPDAPEVGLQAATCWTVRDRRVVRRPTIFRTP
jgi:hypothetical protein